MIIVYFFLYLFDYSSISSLKLNVCVVLHVSCLYSFFRFFAPFFRHGAMFLHVPLEFCCSSTASSMFCLFMSVFCQDSSIICSTRRDFKFIFRAPFQLVGLGAFGPTWSWCTCLAVAIGSHVRCGKPHEIFLLLFFGKFQRLVSPISQLYNITIIRKEDHDLI